MAARAEGPLLVIDGDSFAHRAYHGVPKSVRRVGGKAGNEILGFTNYVVRLIEAEKPLAVFVATTSAVGNGLPPSSTTVPRIVDVVPCANAICVVARHTISASNKKMRENLRAMDPSFISPAQLRFVRSTRVAARPAAFRTTRGRRASS